MFMNVHMCMGVCMYVCSIKRVCACVFISVCVCVHVIYVTVSFVCKHMDGSLNRCGAGEHTDSREQGTQKFWKALVLLLTLLLLPKPLS